MEEERKHMDLLNPFEDFCHYISPTAALPRKPRYPDYVLGAMKSLRALLSWFCGF